MKKPKPIKTNTLSAADISKFLKFKHKAINKDFWDWFFGECSWGGTNLLSLDPKDNFPEYLSYITLIDKEFGKYSNDELCLKVENDF